MSVVSIVTKAIARSMEPPLEGPPKTRQARRAQRAQMSKEVKA